MTPTVIIPTFWTRRVTRGRARTRFHYDHPTVLGEPGTLALCLDSLRGVVGLGRVVVIVVGTDETVEQPAEDQVRGIVADFPDLDVSIFSTAELGSLRRRLEQMEFADMLGGTLLGGYGAVRNAGLMIAAVLGSEAVVFVDDDEIVTDPEFLVRAMEGMGRDTGGGRPMLAKTGYYTNGQDAPALAPAADWRDSLWPQSVYFNEALSAVTRPPRIKQSTMAFGGCLALHRDMYCNVPFDPWILRGEDMDYVVNVRMHGGDLFLDSGWSIRHQPPAHTSEASVFRDDVFRFIYTHRKLEFAASQVDLRRVTPASLMPYPGGLVESGLSWRARATAVLRALGSPERKEYLRIARTAVSEAERYARASCERYFVFQRRWPMLMDRLWEDIALKSLFTGERKMDRGALTGRMPVIRAD